MTSRRMPELSGSSMSHYGSLRHSHSTPLTPGGSSIGGISSDPSKTPPATPKKGGKILAVRVQMLDDSITMFQVQAKALGRLLFDQVCRQLNLLESDYFGLEYTDLSSGSRYWLDLEKPLSRQVGLTLPDNLLRFCTKFYTPDPAHLEEEFTRYLLCLQIKRDLAHGLLQCNDNTAALMASYIVQSECGDYVVEDYPDHTYLSSYKFVPHQDPELERKIMENHKKHAGQSPAEADLNLLETARRCELYGVKMHPAKDHEGVPLNLAVAHMGILVFQNYTKINTFSWAKIRKISFKRKRFLIKLHPEGYGYYKDTVEFFFEGRNECKNFWKKCVEHHGFFRCATIKPLPRHKTRVISRGSSFRYSGRTQKQIVEFVRENYVKRQNFERSAIPPRSQSFRHSRCVHSSVASVGTSISAHPLLPLGDNAVAGTPASLSCGSMTLEDPGSPGGRYPGSAPCTSPAHTIEHHHHHHAHHHSHQGLAGIGRPTSRQDTMSPPTSAASSPSPPPAGMDSSPKMTGRHNITPPPPYQVAAPRTLPPPSPKPVIVSSTPHDPHRGIVKPDIHQAMVIPTNGHISPIVAPVSPMIPPSNIENSYISTPLDVDIRRKRFPSDRAYFMAKELLMTERTYKKDLEIIDVWLREELAKEEPTSELDPLKALINLVAPLLQFHNNFLKEVDTRLSCWEGRSHNTPLKGEQQRIGDVLANNMDMLPLYENYIARHRAVLESLDIALRQSRRLLTLHRDFEAQKVCYLPLTSLALKPLHRLLHYDRLLDRLIKHYGPLHPDYNSCVEAKKRLAPIIHKLPAELRTSEGWAQLSELRRHVAGCGELLPGRQQFLRQGCLMKLSRKGFQQRLFLLFSDILLYCSRSVPTNNTNNQQEFKVHGQLPLRGLLVEEAEERQGAQHCMTFTSRGRQTIVAANTSEERDRWLTAVLAAIREAEESKAFSPVLSSCSSSDEVLPGVDEPPQQKAVTPAQRSNTSVHVCWHRGASLGLEDQLRAVENQLSGFLLRKFKNSNGWQKLWVVFTNFCLFFYKTFQDDAPLASLPLLGYTISQPDDKDGISKDYVFKLQFKTHVYFFRAESEYTFGRWLEVISSATQH
ncbi:FERM, ARHGEF and pleckstrin domain-containing protein 1 isoform X2 [Cloeon dipterum]|uniref:FERM, ARHGEF and pleckstrin domain-containing protein 1 isoform X2 n=1 Tax=Cloeon dipterum TaxID=197152 RepID=UPI0032203D5C